MQGYKTSCSVVAYPCFDTAPAYFCLMSDELPESVLTGAEALLEQQNRIYCSEEARNAREKKQDMYIYFTQKFENSVVFLLSSLFLLGFRLTSRCQFTASILASY